MVLCLKAWKSRSLPGFLFTFINFSLIPRCMNNFSIVIPCYNEEHNITHLIEEIKKSLLNPTSNYEILLVDDASTDQTLKKLKKLKEDNQELIKIITNNTNLGQSFSLIKGIKESSYNTIVTLDGDGQNNPKDIPLLLNKFFSDNSLFLVGGIRSKRKDKMLKIISSKIANYIRGVILKDNCPDTGCSLKVFDKNIFLKFPEFKGIHRFLPALFSGYGKNTVFIVVDHRPRLYGNSNYGTIDRMFAGIKDMIKVLKIIKKFKNNRV